jgi:nitrogen regulatory protein PII
MKLVIAYIKSHKLPEVTVVLHQIKGLTGALVSDVRGFGRQHTRVCSATGRFMCVMLIRPFE